MPTSRRRLSTSLATLLVLTGAGGLCWYGAEAAATFIEDRSAREVTQALQAEGYDWADVTTDGLRVRLTGTAPSEVERFRAVTRAATAVDASRILDEITVASLTAMAPPDFKIELLRNDQGISLIGLVPTATDRNAILRMLRPADGQVTDLLEAADHPVPPGWDAALRLGLDAAQMAPQSKISITPGHVTVAALAPDRTEQGRLEAALRQAAPAGMQLDLQISAPRPLIAPFTLRFTMDEDGARFDTCAADTEDGRARIAEAALAAGMQAPPDCLLGLGAPSEDWADAAVAAIGAVAQLGQGQVTLSDTDVALTAPPEVDRARFDQAAARLDQALPSVFQLQARLEQAEAAPVPVQFSARLAAAGGLSMQGRIADDQMRQAVDSFARSRFQVAQSGLRTDPAVPGGWTVRVVAGLEAMGALQSGEVEVTPEMIALTGVSGDPHATDRAAALLSDRLGAGAAYRLAIAYDRRLDAALGLPDGDECVTRLNLIMSESEIGFEPSRSSIAGDPEATLARFTNAMADCTEFQIEAGGHTDSQGSEGFNAELSRSRAQAIVTAMDGAGIDTTNMIVRGYGESRPIATNETEEGREANRRIEFRLLSPHPVRREALPTPVAVTGITGEILPPEAQGPMPDLSADLQGPVLPQVQGPVWPGAVAPAAAAMQGPQLPHSIDASGMVPLTIGVSEEFESLEAREEDLRVPVQTADDDTPRPGPRPDSVTTRSGGPDENGQGENGQDEENDE
ncbi:OmpA family protein [Paracoccus nototheniae]|uniref:OmpA family protein n=1 Tax=Paracoccus nototheniae TaxID=2489002 RepID=UPI00103E186B|nr:OmpA family protein [Paracoccus nototheniae]